MAWKRLGILFAILAAGCGKPETGTVTLRVANWGGAAGDSEFETTQRELYREFEQQNPGVKVVVEGIPGSSEYVAKMLLANLADSTPDVITLDASSSALFMKSGMMMDLANYIRRDKAFRLGDFYPNIVAIARRGDAIFAIPNDFTPMVMYYNKPMFRAAGVPFPRNGWTFQEFRETAKKLTVPQKGQYGFTFNNWFPGWIMWLWNNGGDCFDPEFTRASGYLDSDANVQTLGFIRQLIEIDRSAPSLSQTAATGVDLFATKRAAMMVSGHWSMVDYPAEPTDKNKIPRSDIGVVTMPCNTGKPETVMYETGYAIARRSEYPDLAWKFIKYMTSYRARLKLNKTGIAVDARIDVSRERASDPLEAQFLPIIPMCRAPYGTKVEGFEMVETQAQNAMDAVLKGGRDPKAALVKAARRVDSELAKRQIPGVQP